MSDYISRDAAKDAALENIINNVCEEQGMYGFLCNLVDKVFDAIPAADVRPKWISVEERLPCQNDGLMYICLLVGGVHDQLQWYDLCDFAEGKFWVHDMEDNCRVTHWMPLPEPPEKETP